MRRALVLLALAAPAAAQERAVLSDPSGHWTLEAPAAWRVRDVDPDQDSVMDFRIFAGDDTFRLTVLVEPTQAHLPRARVHHDRVHFGRKGATDFAHELRPLPFLRFVEGTTGDTLLRWYRRLRGRNACVQIRCTAAQAARLREPGLAFARTLATDLPDFPFRPNRLVPDTDFREKKVDGVLWFVAPQVKNELRPLRKFVTERRKAFADVHGKLRLPDDFHLIVHAPGADLGAYQPPADLERPRFDPIGNRVFCPPLTGENAADLGHALQRAFWQQQYGTMYPIWASAGEALIGWAEGGARARLPVLDERWAYLPEGELWSLARTMQAPLEEKPPEEYRRHAGAYVKFFHAGPRKYRKRYAAYLAQLRLDGDWPEADRELARLDGEELRAAVREFLKEDVKWRRR